MRRPLLAIIAAASIVPAGCQGTSIGRLWPFPSSKVQRADATYFDPYPKNDMNDPVLNDLRPRDYDKPSSEVKISQSSPFASMSFGKGWFKRRSTQ
jgi:hypothetical protein